MKEDGTQPRVVVGIDGSPGSKKALRWACDYVDAVGGALDLVGVWTQKVTYGLPPMTMTYDPRPAHLAQLEEARSGVLLAPERLATEVVQGAAGPALVRRARDADLLVVGARGLGGITGMLMGSVSTYCVHHATVPVVVVR
ncbi:MAG: universal stress protein [Frankiaceae bacterium]|nr:universal stress protein [Frankiaceae bacterium]